MAHSQRVAILNTGQLIEKLMRSLQPQLAVYLLKSGRHKMKAANKSISTDSKGYDIRLFAREIYFPIGCKTSQAA
ncbi:MAG: hypothetical protein HY028_04430 [Gammaproteobacteria bacterium]|nr:hypothetical protein [Gammaproteobacteria bacterium]